uniref:Uncharacterized protein n=1 Tax=Denticeps clupeoides TaxID=299321 RepID=A0AAY4DFH8_9TELE
MVTCPGSIMALSLVDLCAKEVVRDHSSSSRWLGCVPRELYRPLLDAAFAHCRPLAIGELVQRWPDRTLTVGGRRPGQSPPNRLCVQALLLGDLAKGVRRRMEIQRKNGIIEPNEDSVNTDPEHIMVHVRADLFVNARSWDRVCGALTSQGPLRLHCRFLRVEELLASSIASMLAMIPKQCLLGVDIRYSNLGVSGLGLLLPLLSPFRLVKSLKLHYCNLDVHRDLPGQEKALRDMSQGLGELHCLRQLSLTALRLPGHLRMLLSSLSQPLEVLELPYLSLTPADLTYLSCSPHASSLQRLDLSENRIDESSVPSMLRLFSQASLSLCHLSLCGCGLNDSLLGRLLPALSCCRALQSLRLALNPLSLGGLLSLVKTATGIPSLSLLLYPNPLEEYEVYFTKHEHLILMFMLCYAETVAVVWIWAYQHLCVQLRIQYIIECLQIIL